MSPRPLVIKLTAGYERPELCNQALTVAATAVAAGVNVSLWLTGDASWLALPGRAEEIHLEHAAPLEDLLVAVLEGGRVTVCTQCALRRGITEGDLLTGARIAGSADFVQAVLARPTQTLLHSTPPRQRHPRVAPTPHAPCDCLSTTTRLCSNRVGRLIAVETTAWNRASGAPKGRHRFGRTCDAPSGTTNRKSRCPEHIGKDEGPTGGLSEGDWRVFAGWSDKPP